MHKLPPEQGQMRREQANLHPMLAERPAVFEQLSTKMGVNLP
jgi:hypothetical protein